VPGPQPQTITLTDEVRQSLTELSKRHSTRQQQAKRARIVLMASEGKTNSEIARELKIHRDMVRRWRGRWLLLEALSLEDLSVSERLEDLPRPGAPPRLTAEQICQIEQLACEAPNQSGRPITHWTGREIADEIKKRGIVDEISDRHAARLLKKGTYNPISSATG